MAILIYQQEGERKLSKVRIIYFIIIIYLIFKKKLFLLLDFHDWLIESQNLTCLDQDQNMALWLKDNTSIVKGYVNKKENDALMSSLVENLEKISGLDSIDILKQVMSNVSEENKSKLLSALK
jgi:hypothetical protein